MNWNVSKTIGLSIFTFLLLLILAILFYWRQDLWLNVLSPTSGGVELEGRVGGNTESLEIQIKSGAEPLFTQVKFFGPQDSCVTLFSLDSAEETLLDSGLWSILFTIPEKAEIEDRWRFGFANPKTGEWLDEESLEIVGNDIELFEGAFAFSKYIGSPGLPCAVSQIDETLSGDDERLTLVVLAESQTEARYTQAKFFAPGSIDLAVKDIFASKATLSQDKKTWTVVFDLPADLEVEERWSFGFLNPNTGLWLTPDRLQIKSEDIVYYNNNFAFTEYCNCQ